MLLALDSPPASTDPLFWNDFIEIKALIHPDRCYSRGDLSALMRRGRDTHTDRDAPGELRWRDSINHAQTRREAFKATYPFRISSDQDTIELAYNESPEQTAYLQLLLAASMRHINYAQRGKLARFFENVSHEVFKKLIPEGAQAHPTWAQGGNAAHYRGSLFEKMKAVAVDIRCAANFNKNDFNTNDSGDGGIDMIGWHPMGDDREGLPIWFAQCGCSREDWRFKQLEVSYAKHGRHFPVMHPWTAYYFMPLDLRRNDGDWAFKSDLNGAIIVDRLRLLRLSDTYQLFKRWPELPLLQEVMREQQM